MNQEDFEATVADFLDQVVERIKTKGKEYSPGQDRYGQLLKQAQLNNTTVDNIIIILASKHITKMFDTEHVMKYSEFNERAIDLIAYLCLWNGLYVEADLK